MPKIVKSIKGENVDFDLLKIKQELVSGPTPIEVSERKQFIDNKLQRRIKRAKDQIQLSKDIRLKELEAKRLEEQKSEELSKPRKIKKTNIDKNDTEELQ